MTALVFDFEDINRNFTYDPETGLFYHKVKPSNGVDVGSVAGTKHCRGYIQLSIRKKFILAHRAAWFVVYGTEPPAQIDHINGNKADNRICNLRLASSHENMFNVGRKSNNKSGFKGVRWEKGKWEANIVAYGKKIYLGRFDSIELARDAYANAAKIRHGQFAKVA